MTNVVFDWVEDTADSPGDYYRPLKLFGLERMVNSGEMTEGMEDKIIRKNRKV